MIKLRKHFICDVCNSEVENLYNVSVCDSNNGDHENSNIIKFDVCESCMRHNDLYKLIERMETILQNMTKGGNKRCHK